MYKDANTFVPRRKRKENFKFCPIPNSSPCPSEPPSFPQARFQYDGLRRQRLHVPYAKGADGRLAPVPWGDALSAVAEHMRGSGGHMRAVAGKVADLEAMTALRDLFHKLGCGALLLYVCSIFPLIFLGF